MILRPGTILDVLEDCEYRVSDIAGKHGEIRGKHHRYVNLEEGDLVEFLGGEKFQPKKMLYKFRMVKIDDEGEPIWDMIFYVSRLTTFLKSIGWEIK